MKRVTLFSILSFLVGALTVTEVINAKYVPAQGPCILATNHMSRLDTPFLMVSTPRQDLIALVADKYRFNPLFGLMVRATGSIWLDREKADFSAFRKAIVYLKQGGALGIAPEGTRSTVGGLIKAKTGVALLAEKTNASIVPIGISDSDTAMEKLTHLRRPHIQVRYGKPFTLPPLDREDRETSLQRNTDEVMCRIAALLPEKHRGVYANYPRLLELLNAPQEVA